MSENNFKFYDHGGNAFVNGEPFNDDAAFDWRDGWKDAEESEATELFPEAEEESK